MGTNWTVKLVSTGPFDEGRVRRSIEARLERILAEMSTWRPDSHISRFNASPAGTWHPSPEDFVRVLRTALRIARETNGAFDPTVGPAAALWGFGPGGRPVAAPTRRDIEQVRDRVAFGRLRLEQGRLLQPGRISIDLSGIAKGFAVDALLADLAGLGFADALVEIGGELRGSGIKPDGSPWWVELERPPGAEHLQRTLVALHGLAVATSGDYRRRHDLGGATISHTIDPRSGEPIRNRVASVSVIATTCMEADAFATALTVMGPGAGLEMADRAGLAAHFVLRDGTRFSELASYAFRAMSG